LQLVLPNAYWALALTEVLEFLQAPHHGLGLTVALFPLWVVDCALQRISVGALVCVAVYDGWQSRQLAKEASALAAQVKDLNSKLLQSE
jgi:threonine/homoserine efflux transporter RhtA